MTERGDPSHPQRDREEFAAEFGSLWRLTLAPVAWAAYFVIAYATVSLACIKRLFAIETAYLALLALSVLTLCFIAWTAWRAWKQWEPGRAADRADRAVARHRFLGHATFLIAVISGIGTIFTTLPLLLLGGCK